MLFKDDQDEYQYKLDITEYLASFWNSDAVQKIRDARDARDDDRFPTDDEFEKQVREEEFRKNDDLVRAIRDKYKNTNLDGTTSGRDARSRRMPKDMSRLFKIAGDKIE